MSTWPWHVRHSGADLLLGQNEFSIHQPFFSRSELAAVFNMAEIFHFSDQDDHNLGAPTSPKKRKQVGHDDSVNERRKKAKKSKRVSAAAEAGLIQDKADIDEANQVNLAVSRMDGTIFADYMARAVKRFKPELSLVEMEDLRIPRAYVIAERKSWQSNLAV